MSYQEGIRFCHIVPTAFLPRFATKYHSQLLLAHLVERDKIYTEFYVPIPYILFKFTESLSLNLPNHEVSVCRITKFQFTESVRFRFIEFQFTES